MSGKNGTAKEIVAKAADNGKKILFILGGVVLGSLATKTINKILKVDETTTGFKKGIAPIAITLGGLAGTIFFKREDLKLLSMGVTTSGVLKGVKAFLNKDLLAGLSGLGAGEQVKFQIKEFRPELPELQGSENQRLIELQGLEGANLEAVVGVIGENLRSKLEAWLHDIAAGKWGFKDNGEKANIAGALWQMYQNQKLIDGATWRAAIDANNMTEEEAMEGLEGLGMLRNSDIQLLDERLDSQNLEGIESADFI